MTLTHVLTTDWADSANDTPMHHGLSPFGKAVISEMNRIGMLVDLSHVSPETMKVTLAATKAPVIYSHSSARALDDHPRNVPDDVLALVAANGGVVMVNYVPLFINTEVFQQAADRAAEVARQGVLALGQPERIAAALALWDAAHPVPRATLSQVADHIDHIAKIAGHDHVGLGADLDGITETPVGLEGVETYPALLAELIKRGWSDADIAKFAGGNILRVLERTEAVAAQMRGTLAETRTQAEIDTPMK
jgi:membrane dipeptidase